MSAGRLPEYEERKPRRSAVGRVLGWLIGWGIIAGALGGIILSYGWLTFTAAGPLLENKIVNISKGLSRTDIATQLQEQGAIEDSRIFSAAAGFNALRGRFIKPGEYQFAAGASMRDVLAEMLAGRVLTYKVTIPEGWTTEMALARLQENDILQGDVTDIPAEGLLQANTFIFQRGTTRQQLVDDMAAAQTKLVDELWAQHSADTPLKSKTDMLTLASIVEKETGIAEERPRIAAVFLNRLKKGIKLQSDPTIIYGLVAGKGKLDHPLTRAEVDQPTSYNTYAIDGLPPGPIATPGRAAMEAVIRPAQTDDLYFVADGSGGHAFAKTLEEHNANVAKWRKIEDQPAQAAAPASAPDTKTNDALAAVPLDQPAQEQTATISQPAPVPQAVAPPVEPAVIPDTDPVLDLKPGSVIQVADKLVPIPAERKPKQ